MVCNYCGSNIPNGSVFCSNCGGPIEASIKPQKPKNKRLIAIIAIIVAVAVLVSGIVGGIAIGKRMKKGDDLKTLMYNDIFTDVLVDNEEKALVALNSIASDLGLKKPSGEVKLRNHRKTKHGEYYQYNQVFNDIVVENSVINMTVNDEKQPDSLVSSTVPTDELEDCYNEAFDKDNNINVDNAVFYEKDDSLYLCAKRYVNFENVVYLQYVDVTNDKIIDSVCQTYSSNIRTLSANKKVMHTYYDANEKDFDLGVYLYTGDNKNQDRNVENTTSNGINIRMHINDDIDMPKKKDKPTKDIKTATDNVEKVASYYSKAFDRNGWDNADGRLYVVVNDKISDTIDGDGAYSTINLLSFGSNIDLGKMDLVAHEYTHAVTRAITDLDYAGESGAIVEAYADVFGEIIEASTKKKDIDWSNERYDLSNPMSSGFPNYYEGENWQKTKDKQNKDGESENDHGNVHSNSAVLSYAAYLMSESISNDNLSQLWYNTLFILPVKATFPEFARCMLTTAERLGFSDEEIDAINNAFDEVGIISLEKKHYNGNTIQVVDYSGNIVEDYYLEIANEKGKTVYVGQHYKDSPYVLDLNKTGKYTFKVKEDIEDENATVLELYVITSMEKNAVLQISVPAYEKEIEDENGEKTVKTEAHPCGNVVIDDKGGMYYWKGKKTDSEYEPIEYNRDLVYRSANGEEKVIINAKADEKLAVLNDKIFYQAYEPYEADIYAVYSVNLDGSGNKKIAAGEIDTVINGEYVVIGGRSSVCSYNAKTGEKVTIDDSAQYVISYNDYVYFQKNDEDEESQNGKTRLFRAKCDGSDKKLVYQTKANLYEEVPFDFYSYTSIYMPIIINEGGTDYLYYYYSSIAGTAHIMQGGYVVKTTMDGSDVKVLEESDSSVPEYCKVGDLYSVNIDGMICENGVSMPNEKGSLECVITNDEVSVFSPHKVSGYPNEDDTYLIPVSVEKAGNKVYAIVEETHWTGETYGSRLATETLKTGIIEKDMTTGKVQIIAEY